VLFRSARLSQSDGTFGPMASIVQSGRSACYSLLVFVVFAYEACVYNVVFIGLILPGVGKDDFRLPFAVVFNLFFALAVLSYLRARLSDPGAVPQSWQRFVSSVGDGLSIAPPRLEWQPGKATYCGHCGVPRPERAHHCRHCGVCILRMDHHCPWLSNCVGFKNHKFFILALGYGVLACIAAISSGFPELLASFEIFTRLQKGVVASKSQPDIPVLAVYAFLLSGVIALCLMMLLSVMLAAHLELVAHNSTTIEGHYDNMPNPFDQGGNLSNFAQVFGAFGLDWLLPVPPRRPMTDGVSFERTDQRILGGPAGQQGQGQGYGWDQELSAEKVWRVRYRVRATSKQSDKEGLFSGSWWATPTPCANQVPLIAQSSVLDGSGVKRTIIQL